MSMAYTPHTWNNEVITDAKLNALENGLAAASTLTGTDIDTDKDWNGKNITNLGKISPISWLIILGGDPLLISKTAASSTTVSFAQVESGHGNVKIVVKGAATGPSSGTRVFQILLNGVEIWSQSQGRTWNGESNVFPAFSATAFEDLAVATGDVLTISRTGGAGAVTVEIYATPLVAPYGIAT
jgi:hypothetical protein